MKLVTRPPGTVNISLSSRVILTATFSLPKSHYISDVIREINLAKSGSTIGVPGILNLKGLAFKGSDEGCSQ